MIFLPVVVRRVWLPRTETRGKSTKNGKTWKTSELLWVAPAGCQVGLRGLELGAAQLVSWLHLCGHFATQYTWPAGYGFLFFSIQKQTYFFEISWPLKKQYFLLFVPWSLFSFNPLWFSLNPLCFEINT